jgi:hypothetical protein
MNFVKTFPFFYVGCWLSSAPKMGAVFLEPTSQEQGFSVSVSGAENIRQIPPVRVTWLCVRTPQNNKTYSLYHLKGGARQVGDQEEEAKPLRVKAGCV